MRITGFPPLAFLLTVAVGSDADAACSEFTPYGQPVHRSLSEDLGISSPPEWVVICHTGQVVAFNATHNVSDWVSYRIKRDDLLNPAVERKDNFRPDPSVPTTHQVTHGDYTRTGFDRGHLAPAAAMKWSFDAMNDSFFMTNIAPQVGSGFNQHIWKSIEQKMRQWACARGELLIITGPLYELHPIEKIMSDDDGDGVDDNGIFVDVPSHFFKLGFDPNKSEAIAFILPNMKLKTKDLPKFLTNIDEIEDRSRLDVLAGLNDSTEQSVENVVQQDLWEKPDDERCRKLR